MRVRRPYIAAVLVAVALGLALFPASPRAQAPARVQFVFTSDAHYGITRPQFRGGLDVDARIVNQAMIAAINQLPAATFPDDAGIGAGESVGAFDFVAQAGDIANRMELDRGRRIQRAATSMSQFIEDYVRGITLQTGSGEPTPTWIVPGNHDVSNAIGFYRTMQPRRDPSAVIELHNRMMAPERPLTPSAFVYPRDRVHFSRDIGGVHLAFITIWPDSQERAWLDADLARIPPTTPVLLFAHDEIEAEGKHFSNPAGRHDINPIDRFENLLVDHYKEGDVDRPSIEEGRALEAFLRRHRNITAYFHGNSNWNEFYEWDGPGHSAPVYVFRVDSPMKGQYSNPDETKLSFQVATVDVALGRLTVREALWNTRRTAAPVRWGSSTTVSVLPR